MRQQFQQPRGRKNKEVYDPESGGTFPSFYRPESKSSKSDEGETSSIDDVLAQNTALMSSIPLSASQLTNNEISGSGLKESPTSSDIDEGNKVSSLYSPDGESKSLVSKFLANKKSKIITGGIGGGLAGIIIAVMFILPLKIINTVENLQNTFGAAGEQAASEMGQRLLRAYIITKVIPGMMGDGRCTSTRVNTSCVKTSLSDSPVSVLFNAWKDNNIEKKLADRGIVLEREGTNFRMITPATLATNGFDLGRVDLNNLDNTDRALRQVMSRQEVRREMKKAFEDETYAKRIMYRYKYGAYMERKHGIKRCLIKCDVRDKFNDDLDLKKAAWKTFFIQRVVSPRTEINGLVLQCAINGFDCTKDSGDVDDDGTRQTQLEKDVLEAVKKFQADGGDLDELHKRTEDFRNGGYSKLLLGDFTEKATAKFAAKAIPYVGWIDLGYKIFGAVQVAGPAALKINYIVNSQAAIQTYSMYRTSADEIKAGAVDAEMIGSVTTSLGPTAGTDQGGKGQEASFYYQQINGSSSHTLASTQSNKVYASNSTVCDDGETYPSYDDPLCEEERLDSVRGIARGADGLSTIANSPAFLTTQVTGVVWNNSVGKLLELLEKAAGAAIGPTIELAKKTVPGVNYLFDQTADFIAQLSVWFMGSFTNNPFTDSMSGVRNYNLAAVGANAAMNDFTHYMLGGKQISNTAMNDIRNTVEQERYQDFMSQSFAARLVDTSSQYSTLNKAATSVPGNTLTTTAQSVSSSLLNPTKALSSSFLSFSTKKSGAATSRNVDSAGVTQYAWDLTDKVFTSDPETYWQENNCDNPDVVEAWGKDTVENPITGMPEHNKPLGCKLLGSSISAAGGYFTDELLTTDELGETTASDVDNTGAGANLIVATYNLPSKNGFDGDDWGKAVRLINNKKMDIIGFQEISGKQGKDNYGYLKNNLPNFGIYPNWKIPANYCANSQPIFYNTDKFEFVKAELLVYPRYNNNDLDCDKGGKIKKGESQAPIIWLTTKCKTGAGCDSSKDGQTVIVMNTHNAASGGFGDTTSAEAAKNRYLAAIEYTKKVDELRKSNPGVPIIFTGDFNEGYGVRDRGNITYEQKQSNLFFCMVTGRKLLKITEAPNKDCSGDNRIGGVDYIYVTPEVKVNWNKVVIGRATSGSDHKRTPIYANITIPSTETETPTTGVDGFVWPVDKKDYKPLNNCFRKPNPSQSGHTGIDIPINSRPVLASAAGKVIDTGGPGGDAGNYIIIEHGGGKWSNYQHLSVKNVKVGDTVKAGQKIGISGNTGFSTGPHLHFSITTEGRLDSRLSVAFSINPLGFLPKDRDLGECK